MREFMKAIMLDAKDNVATCTADVPLDSIVECFGGTNETVESVEAIPIWHKIALRPIVKGEKVIKYGEVIGEASVDIPRGGRVSHENIFSVPRDYKDEYLDGGK